MASFRPMFIIWQLVPAQSAQRWTQCNSGKTGSLLADRATRVARGYRCSGGKLPVQRSRAWSKLPRLSDRRFCMRIADKFEGGESRACPIRSIMGMPIPADAGQQPSRISTCWECCGFMRGRRDDPRGRRIRTPSPARFIHHCALDPWAWWGRSFRGLRQSPVPVWEDRARACDAAAPCAETLEKRRR